MKGTPSSNEAKYNSKDLSNLDLAYGYTEAFLTQCDKNIDDLNTRLTTFLGFGGVLLRFSMALPDNCRSCMLLKVVVLSLSTLSVCQSSYGLIANRLGEAISPRTLMSDKWFEKESVKVKASIVNTWIQTIEEIEIAGQKKKLQLNRAICLLAIAISAFAASTVIATFFPECAAHSITM